MNSTLSRRSLLKAVGAGALLTPLGLSRLARAAAQADHCFVFAYFEGGWDVLLSLDPRDPAVFTDDAAMETGIQPAYDRLGPAFPSGVVTTDHYDVGPCMGQLATQSGRFSVLRGINMATLTHEVGRRHFITGRPPSGLQARGPSAGSLAASQLGPEAPVPHLAALMEAYNEGLPAWAGALPVTFVAQLRLLLLEGMGLPTGEVDAAMRQALGRYRQEAEGVGAGATALAADYRALQARAAALVESGMAGQFDFGGPALASMRAHYGVQAGALDTPSGRAMLAAQALKTGLSRVVSVTLSTGLDTHDGSWAFAHPASLQAGFDALARLADDLAESAAPGGGSWLDRTTLVAFSEFARTPRLNPRGGRDHHLGNCALIGGAGIRGGQVFGASSDQGLEPERVDLATGQAHGGGHVLAPQHVLATALAAGGLDPSELRVEPLAPLLL